MPFLGGGDASFSNGVSEEPSNVVLGQEGDPVGKLQEGSDMHHVTGAVPSLQVCLGG